MAYFRKDKRGLIRIGIYFSGTGNTRHAVKRFVKAIDSTAQCFSIEEQIKTGLNPDDLIVFGFPIYYSHVPKIVRDYIEENKNLFNGKKIFIITTKGMFNAYGVIYAAKRFKSHGAKIAGSLQLNMPDNIRDLKIMQKAFNYKKDPSLIQTAGNKIDKAALAYMAGKRVKSGTSIFNYAIRGFLKILPFYPKTNKYKQAPKIDTGKCTGCGICAGVCPKQNLTVENNKAVSSNQCTVCYRCFSRCPAKAITVLGKKVYHQYYLEE